MKDKITSSPNIENNEAEVFFKAMNKGLETGNWRVPTTSTDVRITSILVSFVKEKALKIESVTIGYFVHHSLFRNIEPVQIHCCIFCNYTIHCCSNAIVID
jgi:hypothetical protein